MDKRIRFYIYWILGLVFLGACAPGDEEDVSARYAVREPDFYEQELGWYRDRPRPFLGRGFFYLGGIRKDEGKITEHPRRSSQTDPGC